MTSKLKSFINQAVTRSGYLEAQLKYRTETESGNWLAVRAKFWDVGSVNLTSHIPDCQSTNSIYKSLFLNLQTGTLHQVLDLPACSAAG
jgi:hypothetical protein